MKRLAAHVRRRLARDAERQPHLSLRGALADGVITVIGQPDGAIGRHEDSMGTREHPFSERAQKIACTVKDDHRVLAAIKDEDVVVFVYADAADFLERPAGWKLRPVLHRLPPGCGAAQGAAPWC